MADAVFMPTGATRSIAATTTAQRVPLPGTTSHVRVYNGAAALAFVRFGRDVTSMDASVSTSMPLGPGGCEVFRVPASADYVSAVLLSGTGTVFVTPGEGS
jgi:hypothetical protein